MDLDHGGAERPARRLSQLLGTRARRRGVSVEVAKRGCFGNITSEVNEQDLGDNEVKEGVGVGFLLRTVPLVRRKTQEAV